MCIGKLWYLFIETKSQQLVFDCVCVYVTHVDDGVPILHLSVIKKICAIIGPLSHTTRFSLKNSSISTRVVVYLSPRIVVIHFSFCHMISCSHVLLCSQVHISSEWHDQNSKFNVWFFSALRPTESQRFINILILYFQYFAKQKKNQINNNISKYTRANSWMQCIVRSIDRLVLGK